MTDHRILYTFSPRPSRGVLLGLGAAQLTILATGVILAFAAITATQVLLLGIVVLATAAAVTWLPVAGRPAYEWVAPGAVHVWRAVRGRNRWVAPLGAPLVLPPEFGGLTVVAHNGVGLITNKRRGRRTYTGLVGVEGMDFELLDHAEQERRVAAWGDVLTGCARDGLRAQVVERAVPDTGREQAEWMREHLDPTGPAADAYVAHVRDAEATSVRHESFVALEVTPKVKRQKDGPSVEEQGRAAAVQEVTLLGQRLAGAGLRVTLPLSPGAVEGVIRGAVDPSALATGAARALAGGDPHPAPGCIGPMGRDIAWPTYRHDGCVSATWWIAEFPRLSVRADWLRPLLLLRTAGIRTVALYFEPRDPTKAGREAERNAMAHDVDAEQRSKWGFRDSARRRRERRSAEVKEEEMVSGYADVRLCGLVGVTAATPEALEACARDVELAGVQSNLDLRRLYGQQAAAFVAALPACRAMPGARWAG